MGELSLPLEDDSLESLVLSVEMKKKDHGQGSESWSSQSMAQDGRVGSVAGNSLPPIATKVVNGMF